MLARSGLNAARLAARRSVLATRALSKTITDHTNGKTIQLTDPNHPERGDYPDWTPTLAQHKNPYVKYDDQQNRRNFSDPLHHDEDMYDIWSPDYFDHVSDKKALTQNGIFFSLVAAFAGAIIYFELNPEKPAAPRSFPFGGLAKELGSGKSEDDEFYRTKPDPSAEEELGFLPVNPEAAENRKIYEAANAEFLKA